MCGRNAWLRRLRQAACKLDGQCVLAQIIRGEALLAYVCIVLFGVAGGIWARKPETAWYQDPFSYFAIACVAVGSPVLLARDARAMPM